MQYGTVHVLLYASWCNSANEIPVCPILLGAWNTNSTVPFVFSEKPLKQSVMLLLFIPRGRQKVQAHINTLANSLKDS